ncbi:hypothetical protein NFI96_026383 [Prochilodus magdalenae]|nr:hypothetical protein NFI96_026383 [Prochilodus magdalenae]
MQSWKGPWVSRSFMLHCRSMEGGTAPGIDGLPVEFYKAFWAELSADFTSCGTYWRFPVFWGVDSGLISLDQEKKPSTESSISICGTLLRLFGFSPSFSAMVKVLYRDVERWGNGRARLPSLPAGVSWKRDGIKYLGVYLGDEATRQRNWDGVVEKMEGRDWLDGNGFAHKCRSEEECW